MRRDIQGEQYLTPEGWEIYSKRVEGLLVIGR